MVVTAVGLLCFTADAFIHLFLFVSGTLQRYISELPRPIAVKRWLPMGSVCKKLGGSKTSKIGRMAHNLSC